MFKWVYVFVVSLSSWSLADVTVVHQVTSDGFKGLGASKGKQTVQYQGQRSRIESDGKLTGAILGKLTGKRQTATITQLDQDKMLQLDLAKKTYQEWSLTEWRQQLAKAEAEQTARGAGEKPQPPTHKITKAEVKVTPTSESKTINGFDCKKTTVEMLIELEDLKSHEKARTKLSTTLWTAPETPAMKQAEKEQAEFARAYFKKAGLEFVLPNKQDFGAGLATRFTGAEEKELAKALEKTSTEIRKIKGYPVQTHVEWTVEEENPTPKAASKSDRPSLSDVDVSGGVGGALTGIATGWAKKKAEKKIDERIEAHAAKPVLSITTELQSISVDAVPAEQFQVPAGFKRKPNS